MLYCDFVKYLKLLHELLHERALPLDEMIPSDDDYFRAIALGVAGTGKSFVMSILQLVAGFSHGEVHKKNMAILAPTGGAAGGIDGETIDKALQVNRNKYRELPADRLVALQQKYLHYLGFIKDEKSMIGQKFEGITGTRIAEVFHDGLYKNNVIELGKAYISMYFGDFKQLPPVMDKPLYEINHSSNAESAKGKAIYNTHNRVYLLDQPVRQNPNGELIRYLHNLREGTSQERGDLLYWNSLKQPNKFETIRSTHNLDVHEANRVISSWDMDNPRTLIGTVLNKDRDCCNKRYICTCCSNCVVVKATVTGTHNNQMNGKINPQSGCMKQIPRTAYYAIGMMVKLTYNLSPNHKLCNGSRGIIRDIIYGEGGYDPTNPFKRPSMIVVEFPDYTGPSLFHSGLDTHSEPNLHKCYFPLLEIELRCDAISKCCSRTGFPLVVAKADSVHSLQGLSVGFNRAIER